MFRGKRTDGNGWVTGWLLVSDTAKQCFIYTHVNTYHKSDEIRIASVEYHEVLPETIACNIRALKESGIICHYGEEQEDV